MWAGTERRNDRWTVHDSRATFKNEDVAGVCDRGGTRLRCDKAAVLRAPPHREHRLVLTRAVAGFPIGVSVTSPEHAASQTTVLAPAATARRRDAQPTTGLPHLVRVSAQTSAASVLAQCSSVEPISTNTAQEKNAVAHGEASGDKRGLLVRASPGGGLSGRRRRLPDVLAHPRRLDASPSLDPHSTSMPLDSSSLRGPGRQRVEERAAEPGARDAQGYAPRRRLFVEAPSSDFNKRSHVYTSCSLAGVSSQGPWWVTSSVTSKTSRKPASCAACRSSRRQLASRGDGGGHRPG